MVTGDNLQTAKAIALECGILASNEDAVEPNIIEGKKFRELSEKEREDIAKKITVCFFVISTSLFGVFAFFEVVIVIFLLYVLSVNIDRWIPFVLHYLILYRKMLFVLITLATPYIRLRYLIFF